MDRTYLAFDIEITKIVEGHDWLAQRPLGISVACTYRESEGQPDLRTWYGRGRPSGEPFASMPQQQVCAMVCYLQECVRQGFTLLTWNGLHFDLDILSEESGMLQECRELALGMVDPMFQVNQILGYPVGLNAVVTAMTDERKTGTGAEAPVKWEAGLYQEVMDYCAHDVYILHRVTQEIEDRGWVEWFSRSGRLQELELPERLLTVREVLEKIPQPANPYLPIENFTAWLGGAL